MQINKTKIMKNMDIILVKFTCFCILFFIVALFFTWMSLEGALIYGIVVGFIITAFDAFLERFKRKS